MVQATDDKQPLLPGRFHHHAHLRSAPPTSSPSKGGPTIAGNAQVTLVGGNLSSNIVKNVVIDSNGVVTVSNPGPDNLALAIVPSTGLFRGSFVHPAVDQTATFAGYLIQTTNQFGAGLFFGTDQTGYVLIQPTP